MQKKSELLKPHIDRLNCPNKGFNVVFSVYFHVPYTHKNKKKDMVRLVFIGYSRKSISDYYKRLNLRFNFKHDLLKYHSYTNQRKHLSIRTAIPFSENKDDHIITHTLPFFDKCAFYSIFVSPIYDLIRKFTAKNWYIQDFLELILPIGWLTTGTNYYRVLKKWEQNGIPNGNLSQAIINDLIKMGGHLTSGSGPRMQPFCNVPITKDILYDGLHRLYLVVEKANNSE